MPAKYIPKTCTNCGVDYMATRKSSRFCSLDCFGKSLKGKRNPRYEGRHVSRGYVYIKTPDHPNAGKYGYVAEHRLVAERTIGRYLTADEIVHHINGDKSDNRPENLEVMTQSEHFGKHLKGNINSTLRRGDRWAIHHDACVECGTTTREHAGYGKCRNCYIRSYSPKATLK